MIVTLRSRKTMITTGGVSLDSVWFLLSGSLIALLYSDLAFTKKKISVLEEEVRKLSQEDDHE